MHDDIDLGAPPPPPAREDDPLAGIPPSTDGLGEPTRPGSPDIAPAAPGVAEGSLGGVDDTPPFPTEAPAQVPAEAQEAPEPAEGGQEPPEEFLAPQAEGEPAEEPQPPDVADDGSAGEALSGIPPVESDNGATPPVEDASAKGGSPTREYMIFEEIEDEALGTVYRRRSFDMGGGRKLDRIEARNAPNALRAAARVLPSGYDGVLVPVTDSAWRPRPVKVMPREGTQVELG